MEIREYLDEVLEVLEDVRSFLETGEGSFVVSRDPSYKSLYVLKERIFDKVQYVVYSWDFPPFSRGIRLFALDEIKVPVESDEFFVIVND